MVRGEFTGTSVEQIENIFTQMTGQPLVMVLFMAGVTAASFLYVCSDFRTELRG